MQVAVRQLCGEKAVGVMIDEFPFPAGVEPIEQCFVVEPCRELHRLLEVEGKRSRNTIVKARPGVIAERARKRVTPVCKQRVGLVAWQHQMQLAEKVAKQHGRWGMCCDQRPEPDGIASAEVIVSDPLQLGAVGQCVGVTSAK